MDEEDDFFQRRASFTLPLMFSLPGDGEGEAWSLWFRTPNGQEFQLIVSSVDLILDVKEKIQRKTGWPVYTSRLVSLISVAVDFLLLLLRPALECKDSSLNFLRDEGMESSFIFSDWYFSFSQSCVYVIAQLFFSFLSHLPELDIFVCIDMLWKNPSRQMYCRESDSTSSRSFWEIFLIIRYCYSY